MNIKELSINTIRVLSAEQVQKANSGHPGLPLGAAPMAYTLWADVMKHNSKNPKWANRDRFILSAGHGSALIYSLLHLFEYGLEMEELKNFRQLDSLTPGHPEYGHTIGVEATTGPLGQGLSMAVGMAMAEAHLAKKYNTEDINLFDHYTYTIVGDGCLMEGITNEASSLAGHLGLSKLIVLYDSNNITIEGDTSLAFTESVRTRYDGLGWHTQLVEDGNDLDAILEAVNIAKKSDKPSLIEIRTKIGYGSAKEGMASAHGEPLGEDNVVGLKKNLGWTEEGEFVVPEEVRAHMNELVAKGEAYEAEWNKTLEEYKTKYPEKYDEVMKALNGELPEEYLESEEYYHFEKDMATRASSGEALNRLADKISYLFGGSADLAPSNKTEMKNRDSFSKENYAGSNVHFGVREHAMAAISNGLALHGGVLPYCATFLIFSDYLKPALRLSALMGQRVIYVFTHDSIGVGEDGPTHQPIEQLPMLRSIPNVVNFRPCDARETAAAWSYAVKRTEGPTTLALTRQNVKNLPGTGKEALKGAYVLKDFGDKIDLIMMATGSEVGLVYETAEKLAAEGYGIRVVSMPSIEVFEMQDEEYKESVLPSEIRNRISVEAASSMGWYKYVKDGIVISKDDFGASAPGAELFKRFNFTPEHVYNKAKELLK